MRDTPRSLRMLAHALDVTSATHRDVAATLAEVGGVQIASRLVELADQIDETARQIRRGRYGDPDMLHELR